MKIAIAGSGALGSGFGYMLKKGGHDVTLMDFWEEHIQTVQEEGLTIDFNGKTENVGITMDKPGNIEEKFDVIFIFTKSMGLRGMLEAIDHTISEDTKVICLLNGLGHADTLSEYVPAENIIMGTTVWTAGLDAPGTVHLMGEGPVEVQEVAPEGKEATLEMVKVMKDSGLNGVYSSDVHFTTWRKACVNGTMNALSALLDANIEELFESEQTKAVVKEIIAEFALAAKLDGVELDVDDIMTYVVNLSEKVGPHYPSMHQDIANRRPTEIDFLNGRVAEMCEENGYSAPNCRLITQLIHAKEEILGIV
jgi:2-dehydropantoate 2-reductase